jgi:hypothetical protein
MIIVTERSAPAGPLRIIIVVSPTESARHFQAKLQHTNEVLVQKSRQPFVDAARALMKNGCDPNRLLEMKHLGSDIIALRAPLRKAAKLTVEEDSRDQAGRRPQRVAAAARR